MEPILGLLATCWISCPCSLTRACSVAQHPNVGVPAARLDQAVAQLVSQQWKARISAFALKLDACSYVLLMQVIVVDQTSTDAASSGFGAAAGRAIRMIATPGTHIVDPVLDFMPSDVPIDDKCVERTICYHRVALSSA